MGFIIAKVILFLILPPSGLLILMGAGFLMIKARRRMAGLFIFSGFSLLYLLSIGPISDTLLKPLERSASYFKVDQSNAEAIVVLSGGVKELSWLDLKPQPSSESMGRIVCGVRLYRKLRDVPLFILGGSGDPAKPDISEAKAMAAVAISLGVPSRDITIESKSRNTLENARNLAEIIGKKNSFILVTSAFHMKRASAIFKKLGFDVIPAPCDYRSEQKRLSIYAFIPHATNLRDSSTALHEYIGILWYRMWGRI
ncbi:MAG: YdcF family protein [Thermodesulfobacteriota bacterium]